MNEQHGMKRPDPSFAVIVGRLAADPESRQTGRGTSVVNFTVLSSGFERDSAGNPIDQTPTSWRCTAWRDMADHVAASFAKGAQVVAVARPVTEKYTRQDGSTGWSTTWQVEEIGPSLRYATATPVKTARADGFRQPAPEPAAYGAGDGLGEDPWANGK